MPEHWLVFSKSFDQLGPLKETFNFFWDNISLALQKSSASFNSPPNNTLGRKA